MAPDVKISSRNIDFYYGKTKALKDISMDIYANHVTALIDSLGVRQVHLHQGCSTT